HAAHALRGIGRGAAKAVPALRGALKHDDIELRARAARALGAIGPEAKDAVDDLRQAVADGKEAVRPFAAQALWALARGGAVPVRWHGLAAGAPKVRAFAADSLGEIGREARAAYVLLAEAADDLNEQVAQAAEAALEKVGEPTASREDLALLKAALGSQ